MYSFTVIWSDAENSFKAATTCLLNVSVCGCEKQSRDNALLTQRDLKTQVKFFCSIGIRI